MMHINELIDNLLNKHHTLITKNGNPNYKPKIAIYITREYFIKCMREVRGEVRPLTYEFYNTNTIYGYEIWIVRSPFGTGEGEEKTHPHFRIVDIDNE